ncbi:hypothetical protein F511_40727 [Dorcoceras hygrometricum]|uniref:Uncharacterized protein n=1 Tax=Dorcoceras hygrometricum TaxID=472368 RepID=A0A2Z7B7P5_9LAMI|nr:hypothetical protein F511_40727 [Dorcoceras hygrometricum]
MMSLFDLRDVCMVIGSLATLDLPMVVDLIGIYVLKGPYCTLTMTNWFLQALSVIPRGSWGDVARRFTMIRWATSTHSKSAAPSSPLPHAAAGRHQAAPSPSLHRTCSGHRDEEFPSVLNSSGLLVQADEGVLIPVVDLIGGSTAAYNSRASFPVILVGARRLDARKDLQVTKLDQVECQLVDPRSFESQLYYDMY